MLEKYATVMLGGIQVDAFIFQRPPEPLDQPIVAPRTFSVHAGFDRYVDPTAAVKLAPLVRVKNFRLALPGQGLFQGLDALGHM